MNAFAKIIGDKVGDIVEGAVKNTLGLDDKDKHKGGGKKSLFGGDKKEEKDKGGIFSFGHDKKKKEEKEKGGKFFHKDEDEKGKQKKSGFQGLFAEGQGGGAMGGGDMGGGAAEGEEPHGSGGQIVAVTDRDLFDDLMELAEETSKKA